MTDISNTAVEETRDLNRDVYRPLSLFLFLVLSLGTLFTFAHPIQRTYHSWGSETAYNENGLWIFLGACGILLWQRKRLRAIPKNINYTGLVLLILALLWSLAFKRGDINAMQTIGLIGAVWSMILYLGGWTLARASLFPLVLMLFTVQWGLGSSVVSLEMRIRSTQIAVWFINLTGAPFGIEVLRQGTNVSMVGMPNLAFDVAAACSGLQSLIMTAVLGLVMAFLMLKTWWKRIVMILLIPPIAILNNSLRLVLIAYCGKFFTWIERLFGLDDGWGARVAFGAFHEYPGLVVYIMGFAFVWFAALYLERLPGIERTIRAQKAAEKAARKEARRAAEEQNEETDDVSPETESSDTPDTPDLPPDYQHYGRMWPHIIVVLILIIATYVTGHLTKQNVVYTQGIPSALAHPTLVIGEQGYKMQPLPYITNFPQTIDSFRRIDMPISEEELRQLPDDTEYFRAYFIPEDSYARYSALFTAILTSAPLSHVEYKAHLAHAMPGTNLTNAPAQRMIRILEQIHETLQDQPSFLTVDMLHRIHLIASVQTANDPEAVMLAIVQNHKDRHSIHPPEACFPAQGWQIGDTYPVEITLADTPITAARMDAGLAQMGLREVVLYWYQCEGRDGAPIYATRNYPWLPFKTAFDMILYGRGNRWAFVRLSTSLHEEEDYDDAFVRLENFIRKIEPYLIYN